LSNQVRAAAEAGADRGGHSVLRTDHHPSVLDGIPIRWPDPGDLRSEVLAGALIASPVATRQYIGGLKLALDRSATIDQLLDELYRAGIHFAQHHAAEAGGLLLDLAGAIGDSLYEREAVGR
jgi:hypothetical protein